MKWAIIVQAALGTLICMTLSAQTNTGGTNAAAAQAQTTGQHSTPMIPMQASGQIAVEAAPPQVEVKYSGTEAYKHLVSDVAQEVDKQFWSWGKIISAALLVLIGLYGVKTVRDLRIQITADVKEELRSTDTLKRLVEESVQSNITVATEKRLSVVAKELAFYRLSNLANSLRTGKGFTNTERDAAMASLEELCADTSITARDEFAEVLEKIVDAFVAADLNYYVNLIEEKLSLVIGQVPGIVQTLLHHYGMRVLGDVQRETDTISRFQRYADACNRFKFYGLYLPYMMAYEYHDKRSGWESRIDALIQDANLLDDEHKDKIKAVLVRNAVPSKVSNEPTGQVVRFCQAFDDFIKAYGDKLGIVKAGVNNRGKGRAKRASGNE